MKYGKQGEKLYSQRMARLTSIAAAELYNEALKLYYDHFNSFLLSLKTSSQSMTNILLIIIMSRC